MILSVEVPDEIASEIPQGYRLEYRKPLKGERFFNSCDTWETANINISCHRFVLTPKHTWPAWLKCAAIHRDAAGFIGHKSKPTKSAIGYLSNHAFCIPPIECLTDPLPALEVGECLMNPNWKE